MQQGIECSKSFVVWGCAARKSLRSRDRRFGRNRVKVNSVRLRDQLAVQVARRTWMSNSPGQSTPCEPFGKLEARTHPATSASRTPWNARVIFTASPGLFLLSLKRQPEAWIIPQLPCVPRHKSPVGWREGRGCLRIEGICLAVAAHVRDIVRPGGVESRRHEGAHGLASHSEHVRLPHSIVRARVDHPEPIGQLTQEDLAGSRGSPESGGA